MFARNRLKITSLIVQLVANIVITYNQEPKRERERDYWLVLAQY